MCKYFNIPNFNPYFCVTFQADVVPYSLLYGWLNPSKNPGVVSQRVTRV